MIKNAVSVYYTRGSITSTTQGFYIQTGFLALPDHFLFTASGRGVTEIFVHDPASSGNTDFCISRCKYVKLPSLDLAVVLITGQAPRTVSNILTKFMTAGAIAAAGPRFPVALLGPRIKEPEVVVCAVFSSTHQRVLSYDVHRQSYSPTTAFWYPASTQPGDCGSLLLFSPSFDPGPAFIMGHHVLGSTIQGERKVGMSNGLSREDLTSAISLLTSETITPPHTPPQPLPVEDDAQEEHDSSDEDENADEPDHAADVVFHRPTSPVHLSSMANPGEWDSTVEKGLVAHHYSLQKGPMTYDECVVLQGLEGCSTFAEFDVLDQRLFQLYARPCGGVYKPRALYSTTGRVPCAWIDAVECPDGVERAPVPLGSTDDGHVLGIALLAKLRATESHPVPVFTNSGRAAASNIFSRLHYTLQSPLSLHEVLNGTGSIGPIDLTSSGGYDVPGKKRLLADRGDDDLLTPTALGRAIWDRAWAAVNGTDDEWKDFIASNPYIVIPKDEVLKRGKRTRAVYGASSGLFMLQKSIFATALAAVMQDPIFSALSVGLRCASIGWTHLAEHLADIRHAAAADWQDFDKTLNPTVLHVVAKALADAVVAAHPNPHIPNWRRTVMRVVTSCISARALFGDVYAAFTMMFSGCLLTTLLGGAANYVIISDSLARCHVNPDAFYANFIATNAVSITTYSDDLLISISRQLLRNTAQFTLAGFGENVFENYGMTITNGLKTRKGLIAEDFGHLTNPSVTFLKRTFVAWPGDGLYLCPLDQNSIYKCLLYRWKNITDIAYYELIQSVVQNEASLHDEAFFSEITDLLEKIRPDDCTHPVPKQHQHALREIVMDGVSPVSDPLSSLLPDYIATPSHRMMDLPPLDLTRPPPSLAGLLHTQATGPLPPYNPSPVTVLESGDFPTTLEAGDEGESGPSTSHLDVDDPGGAATSTAPRAEVPRSTPGVGTQENAIPSTWTSGRWALPQVGLTFPTPGQTSSFKFPQDFFTSQPWTDRSTFISLMNCDRVEITIEVNAPAGSYGAGIAAVVPFADKFGDDIDDQLTSPFIVSGFQHVLVLCAANVRTYTLSVPFATMVEWIDASIVAHRSTLGARAQTALGSVWVVLTGLVAPVSSSPEPVTYSLYVQPCGLAMVQPNPSATAYATTLEAGDDIIEAALHIAAPSIAPAASLARAAYRTAAGHSIPEEPATAVPVASFATSSSFTPAMGSAWSVTGGLDAANRIDSAGQPDPLNVESLGERWYLYRHLTAPFSSTSGSSVFFMPLNPTTVVPSNHALQSQVVYVSPSAQATGFFRYYRYSSVDVEITPIIPPLSSVSFAVYAGRFDPDIVTADTLATSTTPYAAIFQATGGPHVFNIPWLAPTPILRVVPRIASNILVTRPNQFQPYTDPAVFSLFFLNQPTGSFTGAEVNVLVRMRFHGLQVFTHCVIDHDGPSLFDLNFLDAAQAIAERKKSEGDEVIVDPPQTPSHHVVDSSARLTPRPARTTLEAGDELGYGMAPTRDAENPVGVSPVDWVVSGDDRVPGWCAGERVTSLATLLHRPGVVYRPGAFAETITTTMLPSDVLETINSVSVPVCWTSSNLLDPESPLVKLHTWMFSTTCGYRGSFHVSVLGNSDPGWNSTGPGDVKSLGSYLSFRPPHSSNSPLVTEQGFTTTITRISSAYVRSLGEMLASGCAFATPGVTAVTTLRVPYMSPLNMNPNPHHISSPNPSTTGAVISALQPYALITSYAAVSGETTEQTYASRLPITVRTADDMEFFYYIPPMDMHIDVGTLSVWLFDTIGDEPWVAPPTI